MTPVWPIFSCLWPTYHLQAISCPQWALGAHLPEAEQRGLAAGQILVGLAEYAWRMFLARGWHFISIVL